MAFLISGKKDSGKKAGNSEAAAKGSASIEEFNKLRRWYSDELKRKDAIIDELQRNNMLLMKTALKRTAEQQKLKDSFEEIKKRVFNRTKD